MRTTIIDGKKVIYWNNKPTTPPINTIRQVYKKLPDNKNVPVMFMTRKQYLELYIKNQERVNGSKFTQQEKKQYIKQEMPVYRNIISRYTTNNNPYFPPAVVFFNDNRIKDFKNTADHEYGHEHFEKNGIQPVNEERAADNWRKVKKQKQSFNPIGKILGRRW